MKGNALKKFKLLFNPDGASGGGAFALPVAPAAPGEVVGVITSGNDPAPTAPAQQAPAQQGNIPQGNNAVPPTSQTEHNVVISNENDPYDPWRSIPKVEPGPQDPASQPAPQQQPSQLGENTFVSEDGQWINVYKPHPQTGQMGLYTRVANSPVAISTYLQNQLNYIDQLRMQPPMHQPAPVNQPPQQAAPPPVADMDLRRLAVEIYGDDVEVEPLAKFGEKLMEMAEQKVLNRVTRASQEQQYVQRQVSEYQAIRAEDPSFDLSIGYDGRPVNPLAHRIMQDYPNAGAREVHAMYTYWNSRNGGTAPANQAQPAAPPPNNQPVVPIRQPNQNPQAFQRPSGSAGPGGQPGGGDTPFVNSAVQAYYRIMGPKATPQGAANARNDAMALERAGGNQL